MLQNGLENMFIKYNILDSQFGLLTKSVSKLPISLKTRKNVTIVTILFLML